MIKRLLIICITLTILLTACSFNQDKLSVQEMQEDLEEFLLYYQLIHPAYRTDPELAKAFEETYQDVYDSLTKPLTETEFMLELMRIVKPLNDGHAFIYYLGEIEYLPIRFAWLEEGPVVTISQSDKIERGDQIISFNDKDAADILAELDSIISTENIYWVRHRGASLLTHDYTLKALGLLNSDRTVTMNIKNNAGEVHEVTVPLIDEPVLPDYELVETEFYPEQGTALFRFNRCENNTEYREALASFFYQVDEQGIPTVILDLRNNLGGDSRVIGEFISYLDVEGYADFYEVVNIPINRSNQHAEHVFDGDLYIATSNATFSSGKAMTAVLKFNEMGKTIGEPTGNATSAFGHTEWLQLPNSGLAYGVSIRKWVMPNTEDNYQEAVMPDIPVLLTRDDIINDHDPVLDWIFTNH